MSTNRVPSCPDDCNGLLPENTFDYCKQDIHTGEVDMVFFANGNAECFTDYSSSVEWINRVSKTSLDPNAIRQFRGSGDFPAGTNDAIDISLCQKYYGEKSFTLNFTIEDTSDENRAIQRWFECQTSLKMWFRSGGLMWGDNCGIDVQVNANYVIERGCKTIHKIELTITWDNNYTPLSVDSPI